MAANGKKSFGERVKGWFRSSRKRQNTDALTSNPDSSRSNILADFMAAPKLRAPSLGSSSASALDPKSLHKLVLIFVLVLIAWFSADLISLLIGDYIPEPPVSRMSRFGDSGSQVKSIGDYQVIIGRNLFNSRGLIPGDEVPGTPSDRNNTPVKTQLPLNLIGTVILQDGLRSIATIEDKSDNQVYPVRVDDEIPNKLRIISIEATKVIFLNSENGQREYIDLPEELQGAQLSINMPTKSVTKKNTGTGTGIEQLSPTQFNLPRDEINKALGDWNKVLTEARAIPNMENGMQNGYKLIQIVPGSVYDKLGLKNGDVLCGVNGEPINDPGRAMELITLLKTSSRIEMCVKRDGKQSSFAYDIR